MNKPIIIVDGIYFEAHSEKKLDDSISMPILYPFMQLLEDVKSVTPLQFLSYRDIVD